MKLVLDGFLIAISKSGQVIYCSENVTPVLGHTPESIMNESFFQLVHEAERSEIFQKLSQGQSYDQNSIINNGNEAFPVPQGMFYPTSVVNSVVPGVVPEIVTPPDSLKHEKGLNQNSMEFFCHLKRGNPEMDESNSFDQCSLTGTFRRFTQNSKY